MTEDGARKGLSIFDNAPTGGFHVRSRGYDREQVERYVRKLEDKLREATTRAAERGEQLTRAEERMAELSGEVTALRERLDAAETKLRHVDAPSFAGLGEHVANLLASAEDQSAQLVTTAAAEADRLRAEARVEADRLRTDARAEADRMVTDAQTHSDQVRQATDEYRTRSEQEAATALEEAAADAARMRQEASGDATAARVQAVEEAKALLADARDAGARVQAASDADAEAQREAAATLLHEARRRADHHLGAVTAALTALQQRLQAGTPLGSSPSPQPEAAADEDAAPAEPIDPEHTQLIAEVADDEPAAAGSADEETQLFPAADRD